MVVRCDAWHRHRGIPCAPKVCRAALLAMCEGIDARSRTERAERTRDERAAA